MKIIAKYCDIHCPLEDCSEYPEDSIELINLKDYRTVDRREEERVSNQNL